MDVKTLQGKKVIIYGAGHIARLAVVFLRNMLPNFGDIICGCAVSADKHPLDQIEGVPVRNLDEYVKQGVDYYFLIAVKGKFVSQILGELEKYNFKNYIIFSPQEHIHILEKIWMQENLERYNLFYGIIDKHSMTEDEYLTFLSKQLKNDGLNFEINLADHCNLNCQSCNHFSPIADKIFARADQLKEDLLRISEVFCGQIGRVMLLGGEPLLHPEINEILKVARECLPDTSLELVSNGLLLPKMDEDFWKLMRDLRIELNVTVYPVKFDYDKYEKIAKEYGIVSSFTKTSLNALQEPIKTTYLMPIKDEPTFNPYQMYAKCAHANFCVVLQEGRIYNCSFTANVHHYNKFYGKRIPSGEEVSLDIYTSTREDINEFLKRPNEMCSHCDICGYIYDIPWAVSKKKEEEWTGEQA